MKSEHSMWQLPRYKIDWRDICAIIPIYLPDGTNGCQIFYADGSMEQITARLSWVLDDLLNYRRSSKAILLQQSRWMMQQLGYRQQRRLPLILEDGFCLVPVKARQTVNHNHAVDGYIVLSKVKRTYQYNNDTNVILKNHHNMIIMDSLRTVRQNLQLAAELERCLSCIS